MWVYMLQVKIKFSPNQVFFMACGTRGEFHEGSKKFSFSQKKQDSTTFKEMERKLNLR